MSSGNCIRRTLFRSLLRSDQTGGVCREIFLSCSWMMLWYSFNNAVSTFNLRCRNLRRVSHICRWGWLTVIFLRKPNLIKVTIERNVWKLICEFEGLLAFGCVFDSNAFCLPKSLHDFCNFICFSYRQFSKNNQIWNDVIVSCCSFNGTWE